MKKYLTLEFLAGYRAYIGIVVYILACAAEWIGIDIPDFQAPDYLTAFTHVMVALGIYERVKLIGK